MADLFSTMASIIASYLPATMFFLGCSVAVVGTGYLVLRALDALTMYLIQSGPAYADLLRFLRWRWRTPDKSIDPLRLYEAANALYKSARWVANSLSPEHQTELWTALRDALRLPEGTATAMGLGANSNIAHVHTLALTADDDPEKLLARISYCNAQNGADAMEMRSLAMDYFRRQRDRAMHTVAPGLLPVPPWVRAATPHDPTDGRVDR
jgi:hypothetical protein